MTAPVWICRDVHDPKQPCRFVAHCAESRQRVQSAQLLSLGRWIQRGTPMWGPACWAFEMLTARFGTEVQAERAAIQAEGNARECQS